MMACHHVKPSGMRALPVRYVAMLQLINSPTFVPPISLPFNGAVIYINIWGKIEHTEVMERQKRPRSSLGPNWPDIVILHYTSASRGRHTKKSTRQENSERAYNEARATRQLDALENTRQGHCNREMLTIYLLSFFSSFAGF